jgi:type II secretory pathway component GspD/PulD (secretin)
VIASQDAQALDQFERLLMAVVAGLAAEEPGLTVFCLKHAKADVVAETLDAMLSDRSGSSVRITAEPRLNALIVQANRSDADAVERLLKILDRKESPQEILAQAKPRIVAVANASAQDVAEVIRRVYQDRMTGGSGRGPGQVPGPFQGFSPAPPEAPQEVFQQMAMLGAMRQLGGPQRGSGEELPKMSLGVVVRTNTLVVAAPDPLFREVEDLVGQLDRAAIRSRQTVQIVAFRGTDSGLLRQAIAAIMGDRARVGETAPAASRFGAAGGQAQGPFGQGRPFSGMEAQAGGVASEPRLAELPPSPVADQGTGLSPPGSAPAAENGGTDDGG